MSATVPAQPKKENTLVNLLFNVLLPTLILMKFSSERALGPVWSLVVALSFPIAYGIWDFSQRRRTNFLSIVGFASVLLSGGLGLLKVDGMVFAIKEAAVPLVFGAAVLISGWTRRSFVRSMLFTDAIFEVHRIEAAVGERGTRDQFERLFVRATYGFALSFLISAIINFVLARYFLKSPAGTEAFNVELGKMNFWTPIAVLVPFLVIMMTVIWRMVKGMETVTGLPADQIYKTEKK